jgi:hypothetical protein
MILTFPNEGTSGPGLHGCRRVRSGNYELQYLAFRHFRARQYAARQPWERAPAAPRRPRQFQLGWRATVELKQAARRESVSRRGNGNDSSRHFRLPWTNDPETRTHNWSYWLTARASGAESMGGVVVVFLLPRCQPEVHT